ncbi:unnamed protein product, partial [Owenia fusiformis]
CKAENAFRVSIRTERKLKIVTDLRPESGRVKMDKHIIYDLDSGCDCDVVFDAAPSDKLLILTKEKMTTESVSNLNIDDQITIIKIDNKHQRTILKAIKKNKCTE